jgi:hypothetical protein
MRYSPRFWPSICCLTILFLLVLALPGKPAFAADNQVVLIFGGDVEWALNARPPSVRYRIHQGLFLRRYAIELSAAAAGPNFPWCGSGHGQL